MYLGIDIGTSSVKLILTRDGRDSAATFSIPSKTVSPHPGWMEQDPASWTLAITQGCAGLARDHPDLMARVQGIGLSGQMHALLCLDPAGAPLAPAILWNDNRAIAECEEFAERVPDAGSRLGVPPLPGLTAPKLLWLRANRPEVFAQTDHLLSTKDYVGAWLHGRRVTDMCDASGMLLLNQTTRSWDREAMAAAGLAETALPDLANGTDLAGELRPDVAATLSLPAGIPVAVGGGDVSAGAVGVGAIAPGDAILSLGTSGQIFAVSDSHRPAPDTRVHAFSHCVPDQWFQMAALMNGARPMAWFAGVANRKISDLLEAAATARRIPLFLPFLSGERTPHGDADIRGCFYGMEPDTSEAEMMRAVVDGIAYGFADGAGALRDAGTNVAQPIAVGGGTRSDLVVQTLADVLGMSIRRAEGAESGPAQGAARLSMVASGAASLQGVAVEPPIARVFRPDEERASYHNGRLALYRELYQALKPFAAQAAAASGGSLAPVMKATASDIV